MTAIFRAASVRRMTISQLILGLCAVAVLTILLHVLFWISRGIV